ncbi:hypothetical protein [Methylomonas sp. MgM2]
MTQTLANQAFHSFIKAMANLRETSLGLVSLGDKKENEQLWLRIQDFCMVIGGKNNAAQNGGSHPVCTQVFDALSKNKKEPESVGFRRERLLAIPG